jgi:phospholipid/cholesterol/gamma-HCH transport system ATP-binding protein
MTGRDEASGKAAAPGARMPPVLELDAVSVRGAGGDPRSSLDVSLALAPGEVVLVHAPRPVQGTLLANLCAGVVAPDAGVVRFLGHDWSGLDSDDFNALRGLIGRVFLRGSWLDHLSVAENVLMPALHHTHRSRARLMEEASRLAREFGLPGLPGGDPAATERGELQRAACVRAFMGAPRLVLLEHPTAGLYPRIVAPLLGAIRGSCSRGAAVLWITLSEAVWRDRWIPVSRRLRLVGRSLISAADAP